MEHSDVGVNVSIVRVPAAASSKLRIAVPLQPRMVQQCLQLVARAVPSV